MLIYRVRKIPVAGVPCAAAASGSATGIECVAEVLTAATRASADDWSFVLLECTPRNAGQLPANTAGSQKS